MLCKLAAAMIGLIVTVGLPGVARSQQSAERPSPSSNEIPAASEIEETAALTLKELEVLAAPIALYPDDLVALCISASIYPLQVVQAARFLDDKQKDKDLEPNQKWDGSIVSLLNYPKVLEMMSDDLDWTHAAWRGGRQPAERPAGRHPAAPGRGGRQGHSEVDRQGQGEERGRECDHRFGRSQDNLCPYLSARDALRAWGGMWGPQPTDRLDQFLSRPTTIQPLPTGQP